MCNEQAVLTRHWHKQLVSLASLTALPSQGLKHVSSSYYKQIVPGESGGSAKRCTEKAFTAALQLPRVKQGATFEPPTR